MADFYVHPRSPDGFIHDDFGFELPTSEAAYGEACKAFPGMSADSCAGPQSDDACLRDRRC